MIWVASAIVWMFIGWLTLVIIARVDDYPPPGDIVAIGLILGPLFSIIFLIVVITLAIYENFDGKITIRKFLLMKEKK